MHETVRKMILAKCSDEGFRRKFWSRVNFSDGCWEWTAGRSKNGYGSITVWKRQVEASHRISWMMHRGDPGNLYVLHKCDNKRCVRPSHLFLGTHDDNMRDRSKKGRDLRGESHPSSKLTLLDIHNIFRLRDEGVSIRTIADAVGVHSQTISDVLLGKSWSHVTGITPKLSMESA